MRVGDSWTKIDYSGDAADWMKSLVRGEGSGAWSLTGRVQAGGKAAS